MIDVKIIKDSVSKSGKRITTFCLTYPRYIHSELMTHRMLSKNASSARAIPMKKLIKQVVKNPVIPIHWGANQPGMQAKRELAGFRLFLVKKLWSFARYPAVLAALLLNKLGLHKQIGNRIIEPWLHITVICTATEWDNFYYLRCSEDAHPDIRSLALKMLEEHNKSTPEVLDYNQWHMPFIAEHEKNIYGDDHLLKMSVARCARVSYLNHDKSFPVIEKDIVFHDTLLEKGHMSPFEHQAVPTKEDIRSGNLIGWEQYRKILPLECKENFDGLKNEF